MKVESYVCDRCGEEIKGNIFVLAPECADKKDGETIIGMPDDVSDELYALMKDKRMCFECTKEALGMLYGHSIAARKNECCDSKTKVDCNSEDNFVSLMKKYASEGRTIRELQDATGMSYGKIYKVAAKHDIKFKKNKYTKRDKPEKTDIAPKKIDTAPKMVEKNEANVPGLNYDDIVELYCNQGKNMHCIAKEIGTTVEEVRNYIMKNRIFKNEHLKAKYSQNPQLSEHSWN